ncbi:MAG: hypothetical protein ACYDEX_26355 [Mobilitalea sp.]
MLKRKKIVGVLLTVLLVVTNLSINLNIAYAKDTLNSFSTTSLNEASSELIDTENDSTDSIEDDIELNLHMDNTSSTEKEDDIKLLVELYAENMRNWVNNLKDTASPVSTSVSGASISVTDIAYETDIDDANADTVTTISDATDTEIDTNNSILDTEQQQNWTLRYHRH